ncbi:MAG: YhbY family RNA-binding protein [Candidatus Thermoplasmatota archaeon]|jgi:RNA-binding protein YhbY|nr:YhbY family RNA-binding protein [Candidatus Thermoplasmatota archaeon]
MTSIPNRILRQSADPSIRVTVRVGKSGPTDAIIAELKSQLETRDLVKVKANRGIVGNSGERGELFGSMAVETGSRLVFQRGNVAVFWSGK